MDSLHRDYKLSTEQFKKWILKTSANKSLPDCLNYLRVHVQNIVQNVATLAKQKNFFKELNGALYHGKVAIKARTTVHLTKINERPKTVSPEEYQKYLDNNTSHRHCIQLLQECWEKLSCLAADASNSDKDKSGASQEEVALEAESLPMKLSTLELQDLPEEASSGLSLPADEEILDLDDLDLQYGDIRLRIICFFIEMTQLEEYLVQTWKRVQNLEISLPSATVVTLSAIQKIKLMELELSAFYPSYSNAVAFFAAFKQFLSPMEMANIAEHPTYQLLTIIMEFYISYGGHLRTARYPFSGRPLLVRQRGCCNQGKVCNESNMSPLGTDRTSILWFLDTEVGVLYNALITMKDSFRHYNDFLKQFHTRPGHLTTSSYIGEFINFFDTQSQSTTLLFMSLCWIRSVQCMVDSDKMTLSKNIYLYRSFIRQRNINFQIHWETFEDLQTIFPDSEDFNSFAGVRECYNAEIRWRVTLEAWTVHHNHPLLVGGYFLDTVFADHLACCTLMNKASEFHKFIPWFYFALKETGLLVNDEIPFIENYAKFVKRSYSLKSVEQDPCSPQYVNYLCKCFTEDGYSPCLNNGLISISLEKMLLAPKEVSSLYSVVSLDDHSSLSAESIHSNEGFDELISLTERELLESGYLSVDLLKYFVSFNGFILFLHGKGRQPETGNTQKNPVKAWYDRDYPKCRRNIFQWTQHKFFPFLAKYLKSPVTERTIQDSAMVNYFIQSMKSYFNDQTKDLEEYGERTFIIDPQFTNNWRDIYLSRFHESYSLGMNQLVRCVESVPPTALKEYVQFVVNCRRWRFSSSPPDGLSKLKIITDIENFVLGHITSIIARERSQEFSPFLEMTLSDPVIHDQELAEFVFVALFEVCEQGNLWSMDLLMSITSLFTMVVKRQKTGDTIFHRLAKKDHFELLDYILSFGYVPIVDISGKQTAEMYNNEGKPFIYYIQDPRKRKWYESQYLDYFDNRFKQVAAERRETGEFNPPPMTHYLDRFRSLEGTLATSLRQDARDKTVQDLTKLLKNGKSGKEAQAIIQEATKEDEEKAKRAEQELSAMFGNEEKQSAKEKEKTKKKPSK
jgi:hypothetical protein